MLLSGYRHRVCHEYPSEGWYESEDICITEGKKYFIERIAEQLTTSKSTGDEGMSDNFNKATWWNEIESLRANIERLEQERDQLKEQIEAASIISDSYKHERDRYKDELKEVKAELPPIENGENRYGLDVSYFRNLINRELNRPLTDYKPDELSRVCLRMAMTADDTVINEREFTSLMAEHDAEVMRNIMDDLTIQIETEFDEFHPIVERVAELAYQLRQKAQEKPCDLECGAYGAYCKCKAEKAQVTK